MGEQQTYFQKGFKLKKVVEPVLAQSYHSKVVDRLKELGYVARAGEVTVKLAREFGFCYGVDRAVEYAYEAREKFPDRRIFLSGEIIHNPEVNGRIEKLGIRILPDHRSPEERYAEVDAADVVILPAFGVSVSELEHLRSKGCVLVDTTCGSVLNVWKNVRRYARDGFTAVIHGKHYHEETKATASQAHPGGQYLCVRDREEAEEVCRFIRGEVGADRLSSEGGAEVGFDWGARAGGAEVGVSRLPAAGAPLSAAPAASAVLWTKLPSAGSLSSSSDSAAAAGPASRPG